MTDTDARGRRLLGAAAIVSVGIVLGQVSTYLLNLVAARRLGPASFGELASLLGIIAIGNVVALALQATAARRIVTAPVAARPGVSGAILRAGLPAGTAVMIAVLLAWPLATALLHLSNPIDVALVAITLLPLTVTGGVLGVAQGHEVAPVLSATYFVAGVAKSAGGIVGAVVGGTVTSTLVGLAVGSLIGAVIGLLIVRRSAAGPRVRLPGVRTELLHSAHALAALFVLTNIDLLLARHFLTPEDAGIYAAGAVVVKVAFWLPQAVVVMAFPGMADSRRHRSVVVGGLAVAAIGLVLVVGAAVLPHVVVAVVGGSAYDALVGSVWIFALLGALQSLAQFLLYSRLAVEDRRAVLAVWTAVVALVAVVWIGPHATPQDVVVDAVIVVALLCTAGAWLARSELRADPVRPS